MVKPREPFCIAGNEISPGKKKEIEIPVSHLVTGNRVSIPVIVFHGKKEGPVIWLSSAVHGDEIQGVEIIRRIMEILNPLKMAGTVLSVPIVNIHGFLQKERYLPDRRDLNRSFPGSPKGSLASRIAALFMKEIVSQADYGIDLHTGSDGRSNWPQIRINLEDAHQEKMAEIFGANVILHSRERDGSLRAASNEIGKCVLLFEGGEANRFEETAIHSAVHGIMRVLSFLEMIDLKFFPADFPVYKCRKSSWVRARRSGIAKNRVELGELVEQGQNLGIIHNSVGKKVSTINSPVRGIVVGRSESPLVNQGDALFHIGEVEI